MMAYVPFDKCSPHFHKDHAYRFGMSVLKWPDPFAYSLPKCFCFTHFSPFAPYHSVFLLVIFISLQLQCLFHKHIFFRNILSTTLPIKKEIFTFPFHCCRACSFQKFWFDPSWYERFLSLSLPVIHLPMLWSCLSDKYACGQGQGCSKTHGFLAAGKGLPLYCDGNKAGMTCPVYIFASSSVRYVRPLPCGVFSNSSSIALWAWCFCAVGGCPSRRQKRGK